MLQVDYKDLKSQIVVGINPDHYKCDRTKGKGLRRDWPLADEYVWRWVYWPIAAAVSPVSLAVQ